MTELNLVLILLAIGAGFLVFILLSILDVIILLQSELRNVQHEIEDIKRNILFENKSKPTFGRYGLDKRDSAETPEEFLKELENRFDN